MSIAADPIAEDDKDSEDEKIVKKKKFLEKRKTYEYHEYPAHPLPVEIDEDVEEENKGTEVNSDDAL